MNSIAPANVVGLMDAIGQTPARTTQPNGSCALLYFG